MHREITRSSCSKFSIQEISIEQSLICYPIIYHKMSSVNSVISVYTHFNRRHFIPMVFFLSIWNPFIVSCNFAIRFFRSFSNQIIMYRVCLSVWFGMWCGSANQVRFVLIYTHSTNMLRSQFRNLVFANLFLWYCFAIKWKNLFLVNCKHGMPFSIEENAFLSTIQ